MTTTRTFPIVRKPDRTTNPLQIAMLVMPWRQLPDFPDVGSYRMNHDNSPCLVACADTGDDRSNAAVLLHEFIESLWCWIHGVPEEKVREFDQQFFKEQAEGKWSLDQEPGHLSDCPYHEGHLIAERYERDFCQQFGLMWQHHVENVDAACTDA